MSIGISIFSATAFVIITVVLYFNIKKHTQEERNLMIGAAAVLALIITLILTPIISFTTVTYYRVTETSIISKISTRLLPIDDDEHYLMVTDENHNGEDEYTFAYLQLDGKEERRYKLLLKDEKIRILDKVDRPAEMERIVERIPSNWWTAFIGEDKKVVKELDLRIVVPKNSVIFEDGVED